MKYEVNNPEYIKYIHSHTWKRKAECRLEKDGHICQVCGKEATDVHHLTYVHFKDEKMSDLVSLCRKCHEKAEEIARCDIVPYAIGEGNFMAAMRIDASNLAPDVFDWLRNVYGDSFEAMMKLRQPDSSDKKYWGVLKKAVNALCRKRYQWNCGEDRADIMMDTLTNRVASVCLCAVEHDCRNAIQKMLHDSVEQEYETLGKWKDVAVKLGITEGTLQKLREDNGVSSGPSLRDSVLYYCRHDAASGIRPLEGFSCLSEEEYSSLNSFVDILNA